MDPYFIMSLAVAVQQLTAAHPIKSSPTYPYEIGGNISSTAKIIIVAIIFGMLLLAFFSLYIRKCLDNSSFRSSLPLPHVTNRRSRLKFPRGLDKNVVESFPVFLYSDVQDLKIGKEGLECAVCISEFADHECLRFLPKCHHVFHPECIDAWLASHTTCPVCRADLEAESESELTRLQISEASNEARTHNYNSVQVGEKRATLKLPRSHSTGHSLVSPGENRERYTLRLPEEVRKQIVTLKRAKSCGCGGDGDSRTGGADGGQGGLLWNPERICGRSKPWDFTVTRVPGLTGKTGSTGKSDLAQSSSSTSLPV